MSFIKSQSIIHPTAGRPSVREAFEVGLCVGWQGCLPAEQFVHDGKLCVPLLHVLNGGPGHVVLQFECANKCVRATRTPFLQRGEKEAGLDHHDICGFIFNTAAFEAVSFPQVVDQSICSIFHVKEIYITVTFSSSMALSNSSCLLQLLKYHVA